MERFIPGIVRSNNKKFTEGMERLNEKRIAWDLFADNAVLYFNKVEKECIFQRMFENVYVVDSRKYIVSRGNLPSISLHFGKHSVGYTNFNSDSSAVESGCTLTLAQDVLGNVIATYFPFESELLNVGEKYVIADTYHAPWEVTDIVLDRLVRNFFSYAQVSSAFGAPCLIDKIRVAIMRMHHRWLHFKLTDAVLSLIFTASKAAVQAAIKGGA